MRFLSVLCFLLAAPLLANARLNNNNKGNKDHDDLDMEDLQNEARRLGTSLEEELVDVLLHAVQQDIDILKERSASMTKQQQQDRKLVDVPCNTLIDTLTIDQIQAILVSKVENQPNAFVSRLALPVDILLPRLLPWVFDYDIQFYKICARCSDFTQEELGGNCLPHEYGYEALHSGLVMAPVSRPNRFTGRGGGNLIDDTIPVNIVWSAGGLISSEIDITKLGTNSSEFGDAMALLGGFLSSGARSYTIIPDYLGYGESDDKYRVFLVRRAYTAATAVMALQLEKMVKEISNCTAATADAFTLTGFSEGGYASVAGAQALRDMGKTVINVYAGGSPFRVSSAVMIQATKHIMEENLQASYLLLGATFSNTTTDVYNYGKGQNYLNDTYRDIIIETTMGYVGRSDARLYPDNIPKNYSVYNLHLGDVFYEGGVIRGEPEPCKTSVTPETVHICRALEDQDLTETLETATHPIMICHSDEDPDISFDNIPNITANPDYLSLNIVKGTHGESLFACARQMVLFYFNGFNVKRFPVEKKTLADGCAAAAADAAAPEISASREEPTSGKWCFGVRKWSGLC